jgi:hypothetical protein
MSTRRSGLFDVRLAVAACLLMGPPISATAESWAPTSSLGTPQRRYSHTAVWTGSKMIVWGGSDAGAWWLDSGALYDPASDTWAPTTTAGAPTGRFGHIAVWTGAKMIVWGGNDGIGHSTNTGARYDPVTDSWTPMSTAGAPVAASGATAVWTGSRMIVWGGCQNSCGNDLPPTSGVYDPTTDTWIGMSSANAPSWRQGHTAVWTGSEMIVWGGFGANGLSNPGGAYDPVTDTWTTIAVSGAPLDRGLGVAVWTGSRMIAWGGRFPSGPEIETATGGVYDPATDSWSPTTMTRAPSPRRLHSAVWTGLRMIVWGGTDASQTMYPGLDDGAAYDPSTDTWSPILMDGAPQARYISPAVWTGSHMVIWGGAYGSTPLATGGVYDPSAVIAASLAFFTVPPCRVVDTRQSGIPLAAGAPRVLAVAGLCGVPMTAKAIAVNLTVTQPTSVGNVRIYAAGREVPIVSSLNYTAGQTRANNAVTALSSSGQIAAFASPAGTVHLILDVSGYFE